MTMTTVYPIPGYPMVYLTADGAQMTIRPMVPCRFGTTSTIPLPSGM